MSLSTTKDCFLEYMRNNTHRLLAKGNNNQVRIFCQPIAAHRFEENSKNTQPHLVKRKVLFVQDNGMMHMCIAAKARLNNFFYEFPNLDAQWLFPTRYSSLKRNLIPPVEQTLILRTSTNLIIWKRSKGCNHLWGNVQSTTLDQVEN